MSKLLKGNFDVDSNVSPKAAAPDDLEQRFEREAMKKLGGSIAFVSRKKIKWPQKKG